MLINVLLSFQSKQRSSLSDAQLACFLFFFSFRWQPLLLFKLIQCNFRHLQARLRAVQIQSDVVATVAVYLGLFGFPAPINPIIFWKSAFYTQPEVSWSRGSPPLMVAEGSSGETQSTGGSGRVEMDVVDRQYENRLC